MMCCLLEFANVMHGLAYHMAELCSRRYERRRGGMKLMRGCGGDFNLHLIGATFNNKLIYFFLVCSSAFSCRIVFVLFGSVSVFLLLGLASARYHIILMCGSILGKEYN